MIHILAGLSHLRKKHSRTNQIHAEAGPQLPSACLSSALDVLLGGASKRQLNFWLHSWTVSPTHDELGNQKDDEQSKEKPCKGDARVHAGKAQNPQHKEYND
jgi:hypothetical protein